MFPFTPAAFAAWVRLAQAGAAVQMAAGEVILRRTMMMAGGAMTAQEAAGMVMEKQSAMALSAERAISAAVRGADPVAVATAALGPYRSRAAANARRLRR
jgi:hypothetical protein